MKYRFILGALIFLFSVEMIGQKLLVLEKAGTAKNFKYKTGDKIRLETVRDNLVFSGKITEIKDSSIIIESYNEIKLREISQVFRERSLMRLFSGAAISGGLFYLSLDAVNGILNNDSPVIAKNTLIASGILVGTGLIMRQFFFRKFETKEKWRLKILDFSFPAD
jgi:hypothetical protein